MAEIILSADEMQNVRVRENILLSKSLEFQIMQREKELYLKDLFTKYNLDPNKKFKIDNRGVVEEIIEEVK